MKKLCFLIFLLISVKNLSASNAINYIDDGIKYETLRIEATPSSDYENLTDAYISRGENHLFAHRFQDSLYDLKSGYELSQYCKEEAKLNMQIRALFSMIFAYSGLEKYDRMDEVVREINFLLTYHECTDCSDGNFLKCNESDPPIFGPDTVPIYECLDMVDGTEDKAKLLATFLKADKLIITQLAITGLAEQARKCCRAGGLWKACLRPLVKKWSELNVVGIPNDPSWD